MSFEVEGYINGLGHEIVCKSLWCILFKYQVSFMSEVSRSGISLCANLTTHHIFTVEGTHRRKCLKSALGWISLRVKTGLLELGRATGPNLGLALGLNKIPTSSLKKKRTIDLWKSSSHNW